MSNIRHQVRDILANVVDAQDGYHSKVDVLRVIEEEAMLLKETRFVNDMLDSDPMEQFTKVQPQIDRLKNIIIVKSCTRIRVTNDYCRIDAVLGFQQTDNLELTFRYERKRRKDEDGRISKEGFHIRYSIEMAVNHQQRENLLVVEVWAANNWPSIQKAVCVNEMMAQADDQQDDNEDGGWEDIDEEEAPEPTIRESDEGSSQSNKKRPRLGTEEGPPANHEDEADEPDSYLAHLDPDILQDFLALTGIQTKNDDMHEGTAFFLLMTFPFYEQEWDLVGFVLEEIFGNGEEGEEEQ